MGTIRRGGWCPLFFYSEPPPRLDRDFFLSVARKSLVTDIILLKNSATPTRHRHASVFEMLRNSHFNTASFVFSAEKT
jgi:hypothetical protein